MTMTAVDLVAAARKQIREVDPTTGCSLLQNALILDVRELDEYAVGCLPGAINIPRGVLEFRIDSHPALQGRNDTEFLLYCQPGGRSALATEALQQHGYSRASSLAGDFKAWGEAGQ